MSGPVRVWNVGKVSYSRGLELQQNLAKNHFRENVASADTLLIMEHNPVYTVGLRTKDYTEEDAEKLRKLGAEFYQTNRGGLITFHGPGQLVVYPILNLKHFRTSMRWYVSTLENTVISTCKHLNIEASTSPHTGVWVKDKKICAIGIHGSRFITTHGLALNCNVDLDWFNHIVPCGLSEMGVTSISEQLQTDFTIQNALPYFLENFSKYFNCKLYENNDSEIDTLIKKVS